MRREAHALSRLQHPNIATFFEVGEIQGKPYLALEFVDGMSLAERLRAGPLAPIELQRLATGLLWALAHAHAAGVLHCDIKPANIVLRPDGDAVLLDFGIAKLLKADALPADAALTANGMVTGSPGYMAPEQLTGAALIERSEQVKWRQSKLAGEFGQGQGLAESRRDQQDGAFDSDVHGDPASCSAGDYRSPEAPIGTIVFPCPLPLVCGASPGCFRNRRS